MGPYTEGLLRESFKDAGGHANASPIAIWNLMRRKHIIYTARMILSGRLVLRGKEPLSVLIRTWARQTGHVIDIGIKDIPASLMCLGIPTNWVLKDNILWNETTVSFVMIGKA